MTLNLSILHSHGCRDSEHVCVCVCIYIYCVYAFHLLPFFFSKTVTQFIQMKLDYIDILEYSGKLISTFWLWYSVIGACCWLLVHSVLSSDDSHTPHTSPTVYTSNRQMWTWLIWTWLKHAEVRNTHRDMLMKRTRGLRMAAGGGDGDGRPSEGR